MALTICTLNCCSLTKNIDVIRELSSRDYDLVFLQETFVTENRLGDLNFVDEKYEAVGSPAVYSDRAIESNKGRCQGGLACLWRRETKFKIDKVVIEKDYILISVRYREKIIVFVNVYIRSDICQVEKLGNYLGMLSQLKNVLTETRFDPIFFIGDFNADPKSGRSWNHLTEFMNDNRLTCYDVNELDDTSFTYISYGGSHTKWLDHVVGSNDANTCINNINILYDMIGSDHLPLEFEIRVAGEKKASGLLAKDANENKSTYVNWDKLSLNEIKDIDSVIVSSLNIFSMDNAMNCCILGCRDKYHIQALDNFYHNLKSSVNSGSLRYAKEVRKKCKYKVIPGWNRNVKAKYQTARRHYLNWLKNGRSREGLEFSEMQYSRKMFKKALNDTKINESSERSISIREKFLNKNMKAFWGEVKHRNNKAKHSEIIDGESDAQNIINIFNKKFFSFGNAGQNRQSEINLCEDLREYWSNHRKYDIKVSSQTLRRLINRLSSGIGHDGIHSVLLRNASDSLLDILAKFMMACYSHCYFPLELLVGDIKPNIKDLKGNVTLSSNYRPVMQSSLILKLFELQILEILEEKLDFNPMQFGFREGTSTTDACLLLKETFFSYTREGNSAYGLFVDLSKAFDTVDHSLLGKIMIQRGIPPDIIYLLLHYMRNQRARVLWNGEKGQYLYIDKGVRQGGILSPTLFKLYIDHILEEILKLNIGCKLGLLRVNIIAYADDIVLLANSKENLGILYELFKSKVQSMGLMINQNKSKCMIFKREGLPCQTTKLTMSGDELEVVPSYKYLGHHIESNLIDTKDVQVRLSSFYGKFNWLFRNFNNISIEVFLFLFNSYCCPDYGLSLWNIQKIFSRQIFKGFEVALSKSLKRMLGVPMNTSSHAVAECCNLLLLKPHVLLVQARYFKRLLRTSNHILRLSSAFIREGEIFRSFNNYLSQFYEVEFFENDLDCIKARLFWVQRHDVRSGRELNT